MKVNTFYQKATVNNPAKKAPAALPPDYNKCHGPLSNVKIEHVMGMYYYKRYYNYKNRPESSWKIVPLSDYHPIGYRHRLTMDSPRLMVCAAKCMVIGQQKLVSMNQHIYICKEYENVPKPTTLNSMRKLLTSKESIVSGVLRSLAKTSHGVLEKTALIRFPSNNDGFLSEEGKGLKIRC